ncbi:MAG: methyltransferase domain-containing protein [Gemmatimonadetes bacterium]|nr:methyltransferase domain-containing protein [Gemmatimonadota bacterium]
MTARSADSYVHGYSAREAQRLGDQAASVRELIHHDTVYPAGARVLEVGCGVGAQTETVAHRSPESHFISFDVVQDSVRQAAARVHRKRLRNVQLLAADLFALPFRPATFEHLFISYVLEHMTDPLRALVAAKGALTPAGTITVVEGDHGSCYFSPRHPAAQRAWECLIQVQAALGGDSLVGRRLYPLLHAAGFEDVAVSPRMIYADASHPDRMDRFVAKTIVPMVEGVEARALSEGLMTRAQWDAGLEHLRSIATSDSGTFCYTFFKATGRNPRDAQLCDLTRRWT